ncbi:SirB1 family protein [Stutzerimonas azotifigens]|uniref:Tetratricopeptide repeat protein n=1 Tax=Stutzerimonas azotifigens TaxID=291995 RepID=A0ABR5Z719_9GAMM|nr:transglutaminase family protein [Stutzerimonas azotifigens]MBA1276027.1 tetratricopeptide repeat protein [Stutzerimonas azotifigens]
MNPRHACLQCLNRKPPDLFGASLWVAVEHDRSLDIDAVQASLSQLCLQLDAMLPVLPPRELAQPLLRQLCALGFHQDDDRPLLPRAARVDLVLRRRLGQPLSIAIIALELARRLEIPLVGVNFPGHVLLKAPGSDHLLDPCTGRRLYPRECQALLDRYFKGGLALQAHHLLPCDARYLVQRLSRNLRQLHQQTSDPLAALRDAERVIELGSPTLNDHLARADLYRLLECPQGERFDLEHALLLSEDPMQRIALTQRLRSLQRPLAFH